MSRSFPFKKTSFYFNIPQRDPSDFIQYWILLFPLASLTFAPKKFLIFK